MTDRELACLACLQPYTPYPTQSLEDSYSGGIHELYAEQRKAWLRKHRPSPITEKVTTTPIAPRVIPVMVEPPKANRTALFQQIIEAAAAVVGITAKDVMGRSRTHDVVVARWLFFYFARETTGASLTTIGKFMGLDHSTVHNGIQRLKNNIGQHSELVIAMDRKFGVARENYRSFKAAVDAARNASNHLAATLKEFER